MSNTIDLTNVKAISMGGKGGSVNGSGAAALKYDGTVVLWGHYGRGGDRRVYNYNRRERRYEAVPQSQVDISNVKAISMGGKAGAALKYDGTILTWGDQNSGACGCVEHGFVRSSADHKAARTYGIIGKPRQQHLKHTEKSSPLRYRLKTKSPSSFSKDD